MTCNVYQGVLLDQFGVLHDGNKAYAGVQEAVQWMAAKGMKILILSNSSKRMPCSKAAMHSLHRPLPQQAELPSTKVPVIY